MAPIAGEFDSRANYEFQPELIEGPERTTGAFHFSPSVSIDDYDAPGFVEIQSINHESGVIHVELTAGEKTKESIHIHSGQDDFFLPVLSAPPYYAVNEALSSNVESAVETVKRWYSGNWAWEFRTDCRHTLCFEAFVDVIDILAGHSGEVSHAQFRSGLGYFANRLMDQDHQGIYSIETLSRRLNYWNDKENLKEVSFPEVICEKLGQEWYRSELDGERSELIEMGFNPVEFDPEWNSVLPGCWIAHLILSDGIDAAKAYVRNRPVPGEGDYNNLKQSAREKQANRGTAWGAVVARTLRQENDDFRFDTFNYLKHLADEYDKDGGKGKFLPLMYAAAESVAPDNLPVYLRQQLEFKQEIAIGHNWRRDSHISRERDAFERAKQVARGNTRKEYDFDPFHFVEAEASLTHATAKSKPDQKQEKRIYEAGIRSIRKIDPEYDVPDWKIKSETEFLEEQMP